MEETSTLDRGQNKMCTANIEAKESPCCDIFEPALEKIHPMPNMTSVLKEHDQSSMEEVDARLKNIGDCGS